MRVLLIAVALWLAACGRPAAPQDAAAEATDYTCSMHPSVHLDTPGACPLCGMDLVPASTIAAPTDAVVWSDRARTLARLRTATVIRQDAAADVHLLGRIEPAETTQRTVTTWIGGRIDRLYVNTTGERVRRGQVLATLYSPEVYSAHQDLLTAQAQVARQADAPQAVQDAVTEARDAARQRLRLLGVPDAELARMEAADTPTRSVPIRSPFSGTVIDRLATEGAYVDTGALLYRVADLGTLWVQLDAYERDLAQLAVDQSVSLRVDALPGERFEGRVAFIEPTVDARLRRARVRVEVDNADGRLRPGMFAEAEVSSTPDDTAPLVIPDTAPLFTGRRTVVYVETSTAQGHVYQPRTVRLGPKLGDVYPVVSGLSEGQKVVTRGAFAIDADLQIRGGPSLMAPDAVPTAAPDPVQLTTVEQAALGPVLETYLAVQRALAEDDHPAAVSAAATLATQVSATTLPGSAWPDLSPTLRRHAEALAASAAIETARGAFEPLSAAVETLLATYGNPLKAPVHVAFCPMANGNTGAWWVQQGEVVDNAYFGAMMRRCGEIKATVDAGTHLQPIAPDAPTVGDPHAGHAH